MHFCFQVERLTDDYFTGTDYIDPSEMKEGGRHPACVLKGEGLQLLSRSHVCRRRDARAHAPVAHPAGELPLPSCLFPAQPGKQQKSMMAILAQEWPVCQA